MLPCEIIRETPGLRLSHRYEYGILFDNLVNCLQHCFSENNSVPGKQVCRFSGTLRDCFIGDNCKVLHPGRGVSSHERYPASQASRDQSPPANAPVDQGSGLVSRGTYFLFCSVTMESLTPCTFEIFIIMSHVVITHKKMDQKCGKSILGVADKQFLLDDKH